MFHWQPYFAISCQYIPGWKDGNCALPRFQNWRGRKFKGLLLGNPFRLAKWGKKKEILTMTSTVTSKGQTVVPKALRDRLNIKAGATLDWQEDGKTLRVVKLEPRGTGNFLEGLRRLGRVPAAPRDKRPVKLTGTG
jgi:AbrB family looped-hinge helix DNA binding protein